MPNEPFVHDRLFDLTKDYYKADDLFTDTDRLEISEQTFRRIVGELERFDLSKTGDDIKGLAFPMSSCLVRAGESRRNARLSSSLAAR